MKEQYEWNETGYVNRISLIHGINKQRLKLIWNEFGITVW